MKPKWNALDAAEHDRKRRLVAPPVERSLYMLSKQQVGDTLADLYGLLVLILNRDDMPAAIRQAAAENHRFIHARHILTAGGYLPDDGS